MRLGKVQVIFEYVVDLNDAEMVDNAKISIAEDIESSIKHDGLLLGGKKLLISWMKQWMNVNFWKNRT